MKKNLFLLLVFVISACASTYSPLVEVPTNSSPTFSPDMDESFKIPSPVPTYTPAPSELSGLVVFEGYGEFPSPEIFLADLETRQIQQLTYNLSASSPKWSPDGKKIAFVSDEKGDLDIYIMYKDGTGQKRLTNHSGFDALVDWSPDGRKLAFVSNRDGELHVYTVDIQTRDVIQLTFGEYRDGDPSWSPDGKKIAFVSNRTPGSGVFIMNSDGSNITQITPTGFLGHSRPVWGPNNNSLIYEVGGGRNALKLYVMDLTTLEEMPFVIEQGISSSQSIEWYASRSPERGYILFSMLEDRFSLYAIDMENKTQYSLGLQGIVADLYP